MTRTAAIKGAFTKRSQSDRKRKFARELYDALEALLAAVKPISAHGSLALANAIGRAAEVLAKAGPPK